MKPNEYQALAQRTECDQDKSRLRMGGIGTSLNLPIRLNHAVIGAMGEIGELAGAVERWIYYGQRLDLPNIKEELGDALWYIALACNAVGIELEDVMEANIRKLRVRYPEKYNDERAAVRDRLGEASVLSDNVEDLHRQF